MTTVRLCCVIKEVLSWKPRKKTRPVRSSSNVSRGQNASGRDVYTMLTFSHVNPEVADGDMFEVAGLIGRLQEMTVADVVRADSASLVAE